MLDDYLKDLKKLYESRQCHDYIKTLDKYKNNKEVQCLFEAEAQQDEFDFINDLFSKHSDIKASYDTVDEIMALNDLDINENGIISEEEKSFTTNIQWAMLKSIGAEDETKLDSLADVNGDGEVNQEDLNAVSAYISTVSGEGMKTFFGNLTKRISNTIAQKISTESVKGKPTISSDKKTLTFANNLTIDLEKNFPDFVVTINKDNSVMLTGVENGADCVYEYSSTGCLTNWTKTMDTDFDGVDDYKEENVSEFDSNGNEVKYTYTKKIGTSAYKEEGSFEYNSQGFPQKSILQIDNDGNGTYDSKTEYLYEFNDAGKVTKITEKDDADNSGTVDSVITTSYAYDTSGNKIQEKYVYDSDNDGTNDYIYQIDYAYDSSGNVVGTKKSIDSNGDGVFDSETVEGTMTSGSSSSGSASSATPSAASSGKSSSAGSSLEESTEISESIIKFPNGTTIDLTNEFKGFSVRRKADGTVILTGKKNNITCVYTYNSLGCLTHWKKYLDANGDGVDDYKEENVSEFDSNGNEVKYTYTKKIGTSAYKEEGSFEYNSQGFPQKSILQIDNDGNGTYDSKTEYLYEFNDAGKVTKITEKDDADNSGTVDSVITTSYAYDTSGNKIQEKYVYDSDNDGTNDYIYQIDYSYDESGKLVGTKKSIDSNGDGVFDSETVEESASTASSTSSSSSSTSSGSESKSETQSLSSTISNKQLAASIKSLEDEMEQMEQQKEELDAEAKKIKAKYEAAMNNADTSDDSAAQAEYNVAMAQLQLSEVQYNFEINQIQSFFDEVEEDLEILNITVKEENSALAEKVKQQALEIILEKCTLFDDKRDVAEEYMTAVSNKKIMFSGTYDSETGEVITTDLTYKTLISSNGFACFRVTDSSGNILVSSLSDPAVSSYYITGKLLSNSDGSYTINDSSSSDNGKKVIVKTSLNDNEIFMDSLLNGTFCVEKLSDKWQKIDLLSDSSGAFTEVYDTTDDADAEAKYNSEMAKLQKLQNEYDEQLQRIKGILQEKQ